MKYFNIIGSTEQIADLKKCVRNDLDVIFEKAESVLDLWPDPYRKIDVWLCKSASEVRSIYKDRYNKQFDGHSFISLGRMDIILSLDDVSLKVFAHEVGHAIVEQYFYPKLSSYVMHELMAQYCEKHITD